MSSIDRLNVAVAASLNVVRKKIDAIAEQLLQAKSVDEIKQHVLGANQLKTTQTLLVAFSTGAAKAPRVERVTELETRAGRLKAFKRSVQLTVWEIKAKLSHLETRKDLPGAGQGASDRTTTLIVAKTVKALKVALGLARDKSTDANSSTSAAPKPNVKQTSSQTTLSRKSKKLTPPPSPKPKIREVNIDEAHNDDTFIPFIQIEVEKEIGRGAFGLVYKGTYNNQIVAVKAMAIDDEGVRELITREISLLKECEHSAIVQFIGISKCEDELLLLMEFVDGGELYDVLTDESVDIDWNMKLGWAHDVASALAYLHEKQIIHRDLKSENLLVTEDLKIVKLCDFGFARIAERQTQRMSLCGSLYFNAPELILGNPYNKQVDIYSYGIFVLELITRGEVDLTRQEATNFVLDVKELRKSLPEDCPPQFWKIAFSCCNFNPDKRPEADKVVSFVKAVQRQEMKKK